MECIERNVSIPDYNCRHHYALLLVAAQEARFSSAKRHDHGTEYGRLSSPLFLPKVFCASPRRSIDWSEALAARMLPRREPMLAQREKNAIIL